MLKGAGSAVVTDCGPPSLMPDLPGLFETSIWLHDAAASEPWAAISTAPPFTLTAPAVLWASLPLRAGVGPRRYNSARGEGEEGHLLRKRPSLLTVLILLD